MLHHTNWFIVGLANRDDNICCSCQGMLHILMTKIGNICCSCQGMQHISMKKIGNICCSCQGMQQISMTQITFVLTYCTCLHLISNLGAVTFNFYWHNQRQFENTCTSPCPFSSVICLNVSLIFFLRSYWTSFWTTTTWYKQS